MILDIVLWPDPILKEKCEPVPEVTDAVRWLLSEMEETMVDAEGAGLAAPQVGRALRAICVRDNVTKTPVSLVNPRIVELSPERVLLREGCLSIPGYRENVLRAVWCRVEALDKNGQPIEIRAEGLMAHALQHETEHLDGIVFVDKLSSLKRDMARKAVRKWLRENEGAEYEEGVTAEDPG